MNLSRLAAVVSATAALLATAHSCNGDGLAVRAAYANDGVTQFTESGKLQFDRTYKAVAVRSIERQNCKWSVVTINHYGVSRVVKSGGYFTARIRVEEPLRVKVYLKSRECGEWKPE